MTVESRGLVGMDVETVVNFIHPGYLIPRRIDWRIAGWADSVAE